jgi:hypothetical protein
MGVGGEGGTGQLAAIGAMAMRQRTHLIDLETHGAA